MKKIKAMALIVVIGWQWLAYAMNKPDEIRPITINYLTPVNAEISATGINRLNFGSNRLAGMVGDSSKYNGMVGDNGSDLFIVSKVPAGQIIYLSLITIKRQAIDLKLEVKDRALPVYAEIKIGERDTVLREKRAEIEAMIRAMRSGAIEKYRVNNTRKEIKLSASDGRKIKLVQEGSYRYDNLTGIRLKVFNPDKREHLWNAKQILGGGFKNVVAVAMEESELGPRANTEAYIVLEVDNENNI